MARLLCTLRRCGRMVISRTEEDATQEDYTHDTELSKRPLTRPTPAGESAGAGHPLPLGEGKHPPLPFSSKNRQQNLETQVLRLALGYMTPLLRGVLTPLCGVSATARSRPADDTPRAPAGGFRAGLMPGSPSQRSTPNGEPGFRPLRHDRLDPVTRRQASLSLIGWHGLPSEGSSLHSIELRCPPYS